MGARRWSADSGRFLQQDLFMGALDDLGLSLDPLTQNRYALAGGNPVSFTEWDGHKPIGDGWGGAAKSPSPSGEASSPGLYTGAREQFYPADAPSESQASVFESPAGGAWAREDLGRDPKQQATPEGLVRTIIVTAQYLFGLRPPPEGFPYSPTRTSTPHGSRALDPAGACTSGLISRDRACKTHDYGYDLIRFGAFGEEANEKLARGAMDQLLRSDVFADCRGGGGALVRCGVEASATWIAVRVVPGFKEVWVIDLFTTSIYEESL